MNRLLFLLFFGLTAFPYAAFSQNAADEYYDPAEMEKARQAVRHHSGGQVYSMFLVDRFEYAAGYEDAINWDAQGWVGGDINRIWFKSEAEYSTASEAFHDVEVELLYGRAISNYFDFQVGVGQGLEKGPSDTYGTIGLQGLAPQWFEIDTSLLMTTDGDLFARFEAEYELLFTQKLILQPRFETTLSFQDNTLDGIAGGFTKFALGARLRYEITRKFAPYVGIEWQRKLGGTADLARLANEDVGGVRALVGLRTWF